MSEAWQVAAFHVSLSTMTRYKDDSSFYLRTTSSCRSKPFMR
ncbi:MAG TPA: hypothetical protein VF043_39120 [Ktedonobacteraceae bacterium]